MSAFAGTARLTRLALRRDRVQLSAWIGGLFLLTVSAGKSVSDTYAKLPDRITTAKAIVDNPALLILRAPPNGTSLGSINTAELWLTLAILVALLNIFTVTRHTRQNEETGRAELVESAAVGKYALLTSSLLVAALADSAVALVLFLAQLAGDLPATGSIAVAAAIGGLGLAFAGIAAVTAQIPESSRSANGMAAAVMGIFYCVCGAGNIAGETAADHTSIRPAWPVWLSPFGWSQRIRAFHDENWWVLLLLLGCFAAGTGIAYALVGRRDVGMGMVATRPGPPRAARSLSSPLGLAFRLHRGAWIGWAAGMAVSGVLFGSLGNGVQDALKDNESANRTLHDIGGGAGSSIDTYFAATLTLVAATVAAYAAQVLLRLRSEESGPLESVLSTSVSRPRWLVSHVICAVVGTAGLLAVHGLASGVTYGIASHQVGHQTGRITAAAIAQSPAVLVLVGAAVALFGLVPRRMVALTWAVLAIAIVLGQLGQLLKLPQAVTDISPFTHLTGIPGNGVPAAAITVLLLIAIGLAAAGGISFRRRDIAG